MRSTWLPLLCMLSIAVGCGPAARRGGGDADGGGTGDGGLPAAPTHVAGNFVWLAGFVDGYAIVTDADGAAWAIQLADGSEQKIVDHVGTSGTILLDGNRAFVWHDVDANKNGTLALWRPGAALVDLTPSSRDDAFFHPYWPVSDDAGHIAYYTPTADGKHDLVLDKADHSAPHVLLRGVEETDACSPLWPRFFGGRLLMVRCTDAGQNAVTSYDPETGAAVDLLVPADPSLATNAAAGVLVRSPTGELSIVDAAGGTPRHLADNTMQARFADGSAVLVVTYGGAFERVTIADGSAQVLQNGVERIRAMSPDGQQVAFTTREDHMWMLGDLYLANATAAGAPTVLNPNVTSPLFLTSFSADSTWVLYRVQSSLRAQPVGGGSERTLADDAFAILLAPRGSRVVFGGYVDRAQNLVDIELIDLARDAEPTRVATHVPPYFRVNDAGTILGWIQPGDGLYLKSLE
jgi:hypothetical protein